MLYLQSYTISPVIYYISSHILYLQSYTISPVICYISSHILYLQSYTISLVIYYISSHILYLWSYVYMLYLFNLAVQHFTIVFQMVHLLYFECKEDPQIKMFSCSRSQTVSILGTQNTKENHLKDNTDTVIRNPYHLILQLLHS